MNINFIGNTRIATVDGLISDQDCRDLAEFAIWTQDNRLDFSEFLLDDTQDDPYGRNLKFMNDHWYSKNSYISRYPSYYQRLVDNLNVQANIAFKEYLKLIDHPTHEYLEHHLAFHAVHLYREGQGLGVHDDVQDFAFVFYLNEEPEFTGGELEYVDETDPIKLKPVTGRLIIQPGDILHRVLDVKSGIRCSTTAFLCMQSN